MRGEEGAENREKYAAFTAEQAGEDEKPFIRLFDRWFVRCSDLFCFSFPRN